MIGLQNKKHLQETAIFDVCDTLYYSNTTHDFIRFVVDGDAMSFRKALYGVINSRLLPFRYAGIFLGLKLKYDIMKRFNIRMLKGRTRNELDSLAKEFTETFLSERKIVQTHALLKEQIEQGHRIVLCSSSLEPVVGAVAKELMIKDFAATTLEYEDEVFTGEVIADITEQKLEVMKKLELAHNIVLAVSDNTSDLELMLAAQKAVAIVHDRRKENFWRGHSFKTILLNQQ